MGSQGAVRSQGAAPVTAGLGGAAQARWQEPPGDAAGGGDGARARVAEAPVPLDGAELGPQAGSVGGSQQELSWPGKERRRLEPEEAEEATA